MATLPARAQTFFNLTADEVRVDSLLPVFNHACPLGKNYADSTYDVSIEYPEYIPMSQADVARLHELNFRLQPEALPEISQSVSVDRKRGTLHVAFVPIVLRNGAYQKLVSFKLEVKGKKASAISHRTSAINHRTSAISRYADHSVLSSGTWAKIRIPATGIYQLTTDLVKKAGFTDINKVKIYGYGGARQPEQLTASYLAETDDLQEVATCTVNGRRLFYAVGPVTWDASHRRIRNNYSDYGYYFLTESDGEPLAIDKDAFLATCYPQRDNYCTLYEVDDYAWYHGGRNLYDRRLFGSGVGRTYTLPTHGNRQARMSIYLSYAGYCDAQVTMGDSLVGRLLIDETTTKGRNRKQYLDSYSASAADVWTFDLQGLPADSVSISISQTSGADMRLDRIELCFPQPQPLLSALPPVLPQPQLLETVSLGSRHADGPADMVIIVPASGRFMQQAQRLAQLHTDYDQLRVRIVRADELYNEFSSGTPDANAYRRYLKMLYDRADTAADRPRFLLLFGDAVFDNRMRTSNFSLFRPEDFLLCYESENSMSETACYVTDDYFTMLDDDEGGDLIKYDKSDVAVGRFPCRTDEEAATLVDKACTYRMNPVPGAWQNTICMMGDDGNANMHMVDADTVANIVARSWPAYQLKKIYWDAYQRVETATGYAYPDVTSLIRQQMNDGALLMNYSGAPSFICCRMRLVTSG